MIIAGPCLFCDSSDRNEIVNTARGLVGIADRFRCKIYGGGTSTERYMPGIGKDGIRVLEEIDFYLPAGTEVQSYEQIKDSMGISFVWVGCRNSQNYQLLSDLKVFHGDVMIKRGFGMTIDEVIGLYDIMEGIHGIAPYIIERGINTFDRQPNSRWAIDFKGIIRLKVERPDIFERLVVDCSHSSGIADYIKWIYRACKAVGVRHYMFEVWDNPSNARTDKLQAISIKDLENILND